MLAKQYRLPAQTRLYSSTTSTSPLFTMKVSNNTLDVSRFGFVVSKRVDKRAAMRNRIKRVLRSCIEELHERITGGYDILFFLKAELLEKNRDSVYNEVHRVLGKNNLLQ